MTLHAPGAPLPSSFQTRIFLVFFGMFQITLAAGLIVGWAGIAGSMLVSPLESGGAGLTLDQTTQLYGLAAAVNYISPLGLGMILDKLGPRACSTFSNTTVAIGCIIFALASQLETFAVGLCFIAFGGPGVQTSLMHTGNLFPTRRFFVMGCVAESITLSFAIFPLMDVIWDRTMFDFRAIFGGLGVLVAISAVCSFFIWPDSPYEVIEDRDTLGTEKEVTREEAMEEDFRLSMRPNKEAFVYKELKDRPFLQQLSSGVYLRLSIFFLITSWWANFYIATVTTELGDQQRFDVATQHALARQLSFIDAAAIVCAPFSGYMLDSVGFAPTGLFAIAMGVIQMICLLVAGTNENIMIASFVAYAVFRAFLFPYYFASLSKKLGFRFFGILSGLSFCTSGLTQFSISPLSVIWEGTCHDVDIHDSTCDQGNWEQVHIIQTIVLVALVTIPVLDTCATKREQEEPAKKLLDTSTQTYGSVSTSEAQVY